MCRLTLCRPTRLALLLVGALTVPVAGADWPMYRCDAYRSAATETELAAELHLQWVRQYPPLQPAWPDEPRMRFDVNYEPIAAGATVFIGSARDDSVSALDLRTGAAKWTFRADGPVRFAPVAWEGKVYFAADDGCLYCVAAADGKLVWRFLGGPTERKVLGNRRLISTWPARGAPVVSEGKVYFAAGIWPFMGVFIYCLDAETGRVIWENDGTGAMYITHPHNSPAFGGVAPQGYLVAAGDKLLVPGGRSAPACFDRETGELLYYHLGANKKLGGYGIAATGERFLNSGVVYDLADGKLLSGVGSPANTSPYGSLAARPDRSCGVVTEGLVYGVSKEGAVAAYDLTDPQMKIRMVKDKKDKTKEIEVEEWLIPELWSLPAEAERVFLKAGPRVYAGKPGMVMAVDLPQPEGEPKLSWQAEIEGAPASMVAADDRLLVVTLEGRIYCFGPEQIEATTHADAAETAAARDEWTAKAQQILEQTGATEGYGLVWGVGSGRLVEELVRQSDLHVIAVDPDAAKIDGLRTRLNAAGLYGVRATAHTGDPLSFGFPPYVADLIVSEDLRAAGFDRGEAFVKALFHPLRPYGGVACLAAPSGSGGRFGRWVKAAKLENAEVTQSGEFVALTRVGALPGSADWTHQHADAANTCVSKDNRVKAPLGLLWFGGSSNVTILPRHGHGPAEQVVDGRLFIEGPNTMRAMDVYTGRMLWEVELPGIGKAYDNTSHQPGANSIGSNYVSSSEAVYVALGQSCLLLDPATGETRREFKLPAEADQDPPAWGYIGVWEDLLVAGCSPVIFEGEKPVGGKDNWDATSSKRLVAMNRHTGDVLWALDSQLCFRHNAIAIGAGKVFCIDRLPEAVVEKMDRRGETPQGEPKLRCADARTGEVLWETTQDVFGTWLGYSEEHDILLQAGRPSPDMLPHEPGDRMITYRGATGEVVWDKPHKYYGPCLLHGDTIITQTVSLGRLANAYSLLTGEQVMREDPLTGVETPWQFGRNYGCNTVVGSEHLITFRSAAAGYFDLAGDGGTGNLGGFKTGCTSNLVVANGVLNAPDYTRTCTCSYQNQTSLAFVHLPEAETWTFSTLGESEGHVRRLGINLGAPGDRRGPDGKMWLEYPVVGGPSPAVSIGITPEEPEWFRRHSSRVSGDGLTWVAASGAKGLASLTIALDKDAEQERVYNVALYFMEPDEVGPGDRVFDVMLQGEEALKGFDVAREAGGRNRMIVKVIRGVRVKGDLTVELKPSPSAKVSGAILSGVAVAEQPQ
jgi:outer membrane protein assembly factor BamB